MMLKGERYRLLIIFCISLAFAAVIWGQRGIVFGVSMFFAGLGGLLIGYGLGHRRR